MRTVTALLRSALALFALAITSVTVQAAAPAKPIEFGARIVDNSTPGVSGVTVKLTWLANRDGDLPTSFDVYMAEGETEDETLFSKIGSVEVTPNMPPNNTVFWYAVENLQPGTYTFFVKAVNADGESPRSVIRVVVVEDPSEPKISIASQPSNVGSAGQPYTYRAKLYKNFDGGKVVWEIVEGPDGMTISEEGVVTWPDPKPGRYEIEIKVTVEFNGVALTEDQSWVLEIKEGDNRPDACVTVSGSVKFDDGNSIVMRGVVIAWRIERVTNDNGEVGEKTVAVMKAEIQQGAYHLSVPAGSYKFRIEGDGFFAEWYQDVTELADAKTITVTCDEPQVEINFTVTARPEPVKYVVSGRVYDAVTNQGIANALVVFEARKHDNSNSAGLLAVVKAETNADGYYEVKLPEGMFFIAMAKVRDERGADQGEYIQEWWENSHDATQATVIEITGNTDGISFSMDKREVFNNGFGGNLVDDETNDGVIGKVTAYMLVETPNSSDKEHKTKVVSVETDDQGNYSFTNLEPGDYIVFGIPGEHPYVPGWYVDGGTASHSWKDATIISVGEAMITLQHTIRFAKVSDSLGRGRVRGWVYDRRGGIINKDDNHVENADGIMGSLVVATDANGNVVDFAMSQNAGAYELVELGIGTWKISADRFGYGSTTESVTIDDNNLDVSVSIGLIQQVTSVENPSDQIGIGYNLFPNPANTEATIKFPSTVGTAQISVISMAGVVLSAQNIDVTGSETSVVLNVGSLPTGMTLVRVSNGTRTFALPMQIVR
ncbi:MAG: T9SS type A sorting domain-containing protein [Ignavibacteria bacterium]|nr:T9SS type A sorting domain-containing protein [Ignavibacteria bacterium]